MYFFLTIVGFTSSIFIKMETKILLSQHSVCVTGQTVGSYVKLQIQGENSDLQGSPAS